MKRISHPYQLTDSQAILLLTDHFLKNRFEDAFFDSSVQLMFLSIGTTGLRSFNSQLTAINLITADVNRSASLISNCTETILLIERMHEEMDVLKMLADLLSRTDICFTFNGSGFTIPYLSQCYEQYHLPNPFNDQLEQIDFLRFLRPLKSTLQLEDCRLFSFLECAGIAPCVCSISDGSEAADLYNRYQYFVYHNEAHTKEAQSLLNRIVEYYEAGLNNIEKSSGLLLLYLYFCILSNPDADLFTPTQYSFSDDAFTISGDLAIPLQGLCLTFYAPGAVMRINDSHIIVRAAILKGELKHFYDHYQEYFYLPEEDYAIHKKIGSFVDTSHRVPATKNNCYIRREDLFIVQNGFFPLSEVFAEARDVLPAFMVCKPEQFAQPDFAGAWVKKMILLFLNYKQN